MTLYPTVTGGSVVAFKFQNGVIIACDTQGSYGTLAKFKQICRVYQPPKATTLVAFDGELSDFQFIASHLENASDEDLFHSDSIISGPKDTLTSMSRLMYQRRSKMQPLWNSLIVGGLDENQQPFLGTTDMIGTMYTEDIIATGMGAHMALPLLREQWRADLTEEDARALMAKVMEVLLYRDCLALNSITFAVCKSEGGGAPASVRIEDPIVLNTSWSYKAFVKPPQ